METVRFSLMLSLVFFGAYAEYAAGERVRVLKLHQGRTAGMCIDYDVSAGCSDAALMTSTNVLAGKVRK